MPRHVEVGATRGSCIYPLRLPDDLREQWTAYCKRNKRQSAATLRALMRYMIRDEMPVKVREWIAQQCEGQPDDGPKERLEVRFTPSEYQGIATRAQAEGCSPQRYVISCVRASLTHEPQFTMEATRALWKSSRQLRAIGHNLNQTARKLNADQDAALKLEHNEKLAATIQKHTERVAKLLDASLARWLICLPDTQVGAAAQASGGKVPRLSSRDSLAFSAIEHT